VVLAFNYGAPPRISPCARLLVRRFGLIKKRVGQAVDAVSALTPRETASLAGRDRSAGFVVGTGRTHLRQFRSLAHNASPISAGIVTAVPLLLAAVTARRLPSSISASPSHLARRCSSVQPLPVLGETDANRPPAEGFGLVCGSFTILGTTIALFPPSRPSRALAPGPVSDRTVGFENTRLTRRTFMSRFRNVPAVVSGVVCSVLLSCVVFCRLTDARAITAPSPTSTVAPFGDGAAHRHPLPSAALSPTSGRRGRAGVAVAVKEINDAGGVLGKPVEVPRPDSRCIDRHDRDVNRRPSLRRAGGCAGRAVIVGPRRAGSSRSLWAAKLPDDLARCHPVRLSSAASGGYFFRTIGSAALEGNAPREDHRRHGLASRSSISMTTWAGRCSVRCAWDSRHPGTGRRAEDRFDHEGPRNHHRSGEGRENRTTSCS
jgi:hypothetical protein